MTLPGQPGGEDRVGAVASPLLRPHALRALVAGGLILESFAAVLAGLVLVVWLVYPVAFLAVVGVLAVSPFAAWPVVKGGWAKGVSRAVQIAAVALTGTFYVVVAAYAASQAGEALIARSTLAPRPEIAGFWLVIAAGAATALAALIAAVPLRLPRTATVLAAGATAVAGLAGAGVAVAVTVGKDGCEDFEFDRARWASVSRHDPPGSGITSDKELMADAIARCGTVDGATRQQVARLLGRPDRRSHRSWYWDVGWTNDGLGPGDGQALWVEFGRERRVRKAELLYP